MENENQERRIPPLPTTTTTSNNNNNNNDNDNKSSSKNKKNSNKHNKNKNKNGGGSSNSRDGVFLKQGGQSLVEEDDEGSTEYKWRLVGITEQRLNHLVTQMKFRVAEGRGECLYEIGVEDDGFTRGLSQAEFDESIATLRTMAARLGFTMDLNCVISKVNPKDENQILKCAEVRVRKVVQTLPTCRIAIIGDTNSGKSTLVGVLSGGELDDASGTARQSVFNHKHELQSGQTSSVCDRIVGFTRDGKIVNYGDNHNSNEQREDEKANTTNESSAASASSTKTKATATTSSHTPNDAIAENSATLTLLMDTPGHLKRSHTVLSALVGRFPHVVGLVVNPNDTNNVSTHVAQCAALHLPFFVIFTHQDSTPPLALGQAAATLDRAVGGETGKRLVMVSQPIYPGEETGGFQNREIIRTSSDMFLSDLASTDGGASNKNNNNNNNNNENHNNTGSPSKANNNNNNNSNQSSPTNRSDFFISPNATPMRPSNNNKNTSSALDGLRAAMASSNPVETYLENHVPVFICSSVSGYGIPLLKHFLHQLSLSPPRLTVDECDNSSFYFASNPHNNNNRNNKKNRKKQQEEGELEEGMIPATKNGSSSGENTFESSKEDVVTSAAAVSYSVNATGDDEEENTENSSTNSSFDEDEEEDEEPATTIRIVIDKVFTKPKVGLVAAGIVTSGTITVGQHLYWGPSKNGSFFPLQVSSLHYQRNFVRSVGSGNECAVAFTEGDKLSPEVIQMSSRKGTMLFGAQGRNVLPPATSRDFRVLVTKAHAVAAAGEWKVDQELTAFVFSAKQACFLKKMEPVDFSSQEYAAVRPARTVGDASRPLILHCSFVYLPEVLAVGAPIVLLRNTPDGRLGAVGGRIFSFDACQRRETSESNSSGSIATSSPTSAARTPISERSSSGSRTNTATSSSLNASGTPTAPREQNSSTTKTSGTGLLFPSTVLPPAASEMNKPSTSSPPDTPTTSPPLQHPSSSSTSSVAAFALSQEHQQQQQQQKQQQTKKEDSAAELSVAKERYQRKQQKKLQQQKE